jgi:hypothetical protein
MGKRNEPSDVWDLRSAIPALQCSHNLVCLVKRVNWRQILTTARKIPDAREMRGLEGREEKIGRRIASP